jgi:hypothetical protein
MPSVLLSDAEFDRLVESQPLVFAVRARAQFVASELRARTASVAAELRRLIAAGEVANPVASAMIANSFDRLAREVDRELREPNMARGIALSPTLAQVDAEDYEREAWWINPESGSVRASPHQDAA